MAETVVLHGKCYCGALEYEARPPAGAAAEIRAATAAVSGHATLFKAGADGAPGVPRFDRSSPAIEAITQRLRTECDPAGIFNPGRMG